MDIKWMLGLIPIVGGYVGFRKYLYDRDDMDRKLYNNMLKFKYRDLFDYPVDYNSKSISEFCSNVVKFKNDENRFKGRQANNRFNKIYDIVVIINNTIDERLSFDLVSGEETALDRFYELNKEKNFPLLKERFSQFSSSIDLNLLD
jgi:hypothetical protein